MIQFAHKDILWFLLAAGLMIMGYMFYLNHRKRSLIKLGEEDLLEELMPEASKWSRHWKFFLLFTGTVLLIIAASGPRIGSRLQEVEHKGREIIIALDVSNSMLAEDIKPSRLERSKQMINRMVDRMSNDKIGLIVFAGDAYTQIPITDDYPSVKMFLSGAGPDMVSKQGTAIGSAIHLAVRSFSSDAQERMPGEGIPSQAIVVITDGENHEDDAVGEASRAAEKGIKVYTVGLGDPNGVPVPVSPGSHATRRDRDGNVVVSKLNEKLLKDVAKEGQGAYIPGVRINSLIDELDKLERAKLKTRVFAEFAERFPYFAGFALLFLTLEFFIRSRKNRLLSGLNLFKTETYTKMTKRSLLILLVLTIFISAFGQNERKIIRDGVRAYEEEDYGEAEVQFRKAENINQESYEAEFNTGAALYNQEKYEETVTQYQSILDHTNDSEKEARIWHNIGNSLLETQQYAPSIEAYKSSLRLNPSDNDTRYNLAYAKQMLKEQQEQQQDQDKDQNKDQKEQDQDQDQNEDQDQDQEKEQQDQGEDEQEQQPVPREISKEDAERMLKAIQQQEKDVKEKVDKKKAAAAKVKTEKDW